jgi:hypothetical protein
MTTDANKESLNVQVSTLQRWALYLSQGDMEPRREIEHLLTVNGHPTRDSKT